MVSALNRFRSAGRSPGQAAVGADGAVPRDRGDQGDVRSGSTSYRDRRLDPRVRARNSGSGCRRRRSRRSRSPPGVSSRVGSGRGVRVSCSRAWSRWFEYRCASPRVCTNSPGCRPTTCGHHLGQQRVGRDVERHARGTRRRTAGRAGRTAGRRRRRTGTWCGTGEVPSRRPRRRSRPRRCAGGNPGWSAAIGRRPRSGRYDDRPAPARTATGARRPARAHPRRRPIRPRC